MLDRTQRWRLRHPLLWRGASFDPDDPCQTYGYAFQRLSRRERAVFALCRFQALDYPDVAHALGISTAAVEWRLVGALYTMTRILDLVDRARGRPIDSPMADGKQMTDM